MAALPSQTRSTHCSSPPCQESRTLVKPDPNEAKVTGMFQDEWSTPRRCGPTGSRTNHSFHRIPLCQATQPIQNKMKQKNPSTRQPGRWLPSLPTSTSSSDPQPGGVCGVLPSMSSTWGFQVPTRQSNAAKPTGHQLCSLFCSCRTIAQLHYVSRVAGKMLLGIQ